MTIPDSILIFGRDAQLLETRKWVLERAGFVVASVPTLPAFKTAFTNGGWGLVILCHTLSESDCRTVAYLAASDAPGVPILILETGFTGFAPTFAASTNVLNGPKSLLAKVHSLFHPFRNPTAVCSEESFPCQSTSAV